MIRALCLGAALLLAGCAAPVVTRIETTGLTARVTTPRFAMADVPGDLPPAQQLALAMVGDTLAAQGWRQADTAEYLLSVTLADRPAASRLLAGDDNGKPQRVISPAADRTNNMGCARRDRRLTVQLTERTSGTIVYAGAAAEFHCKAGLRDSLPFLVPAALAGLNRGRGVGQFERPGVR